MSEQPVWERRDGELPRAYFGFRTYRDLGPMRSLDAVVEAVGVGLRTVKRWSSAYDWPARAQAWDDTVHNLEDDERLQAIRTMHANHQQIGRAAQRKALQALEQMPLNRIPAGTAVRLLEVGTRLERQTLVTTPEELFGEIDGAGSDDAWDEIARELGAGAT